MVVPLGGKINHMGTFEPISLKTEEYYKKLLTSFSQRNIFKFKALMDVVSDHLEMSEGLFLPTSIAAEKFSEVGLGEEDVNNILYKFYDSDFSLFSADLIEVDQIMNTKRVTVFFPKTIKATSEDLRSRLSQNTLDIYHANFKTFRNALEAVTSSRGVPQGSPSFNTEKGKIVWGSRDIRIEPNTNQFMFCVVMFGAGPGVPIEYPDIIDAEIGVWDDEGKDPQKSVYDVMRAINKKIKVEFGVEAFFSTSKGTFTMKEEIV